MNVTKSVTINRPRHAAYEFWRDFTNLARFMAHVQRVDSLSGPRSHWVVSAPAGQTVEWDAEVVDDRPGEIIRWRTLEGSGIRHEGAVRFNDAPGDRGTEVHVACNMTRPPARRARPSPHYSARSRRSRSAMTCAASSK